jgi:hypothetical protein
MYVTEYEHESGINGTLKHIKTAVKNADKR